MKIIPGTTLWLTLTSSAILAWCATAVGAQKGGGATPPPNPEIAFIEGGIRVMNADGSNARLVVSIGKKDSVSGPSWSPAGDALAFSGKLGGATGVWTVNLDGTDLTRIVNLPSDSSPYVDWSRFPAPDGLAKIAFSAKIGTDKDVYIVNRDGTGLTNVTNTPGAYESDCTWTNSGSRLVFIRETFTLVALDLGLDENGNVVLVAETVVYDTTATASVLGPLRCANTFAGAAFPEVPPYPAPGRIRILDFGVYPPVVHDVVSQSGWNWPSFSPDDSRLVAQVDVDRYTYGIYTVRSDGSGATRIRSSGRQPNWKRPPP